jgi:hypothetical protein
MRHSRQGVTVATNDRTVSKRKDGTYANQRDGGQRATSVHGTQREAAAAARQNLINQGGGELKIKGEDGKIRQKDTIGKPDPYPPRG